MHFDISNMAVSWFADQLSFVPTRVDHSHTKQKPLYIVIGAATRELACAMFILRRTLYGRTATTVG